jgi:hypothetical protein
MWWAILMLIVGSLSGFFGGLWGILDPGTVAKVASFIDQIPA